MVCFVVCRAQDRIVVLVLVRNSCDHTLDDRISRSCRLSRCCKSAAHEIMAEASRKETGTRDTQFHAKKRVFHDNGPHLK